MTETPKRSRERTKHRLLEAGRELVLKRGLAEEIDIRLTDVLKHVRLSTGAAYNIWDTQGAFRAELALHLARSFEWADERQIVEALGALPTDASATDWVRAVADAYFPVFVENQSFYVILHFWGVANPSPELVEAIRSGYQVVHESFRALYEMALDAHNLEPKPPHTIDDLTTMVTGALEGLALRHRFEPERVETGEAGLLFTSLLVAIADHFLRPVQT